MNIKRKDVITCGFALFAIFFGAGNLIFPPYLGVMAGDRWYEAMFGFLLTDPVIPILGVIVTARLGGRADDLGKRVSPSFSKILGMIAILAIGPFFAVPRTGAVTHEVFTQPLFQNAPILVTSVIFFGITFLVASNPSSVIDYIGNILTPVLLFILALIVGVSIFNPPGAAVTTEATGLFTYGFKEGYQTMDALGASLMAGIVISDLIRRGYKDEKVQIKASIRVGMVAFVLLALVYGGLTYAGSRVGGFYNIETPRTELLIGMTTLMLGDIGKVVMGVAIALACLTTSTGLISTCGNYFESISNGKLKYKTVVAVATAVSFLISLLGVEKLISIAVPVLTCIYPVVIVLIFMSVFDKKIVYNQTYVGAVVGAFSISLVEGINLFSIMRGQEVLGTLMEAINTLPFANYGFNWLIPAAVCSLVFTLISKFFSIGKLGHDTI